MLTRLILIGLVTVSRGQQPPAAPAGATRDQDKAALFRLCQQLDQATDRTIQNIRDRTDCWKRMQLQGMGDSTVDARYQAAVADYDAAAQSDSVRHAGEAVDSQLAAIQRAIVARDLAMAQRTTDAVLATEPGNPRALAFRDRIAALERATRVRNTLFILAGAVLLAAIVVGFGARILARRHQREAATRRAAASNQRAMLEIVDGIGRGKVYTIEGPVFRIGSAVSDRPEEKNDLILSDADAFISRYHCAIVRKDGQFFLIDSSLNGTYMDDDLLERGEHRPLEDGAEFSLAGMARVKFLLI